MRRLAPALLLAATFLAGTAADAGAQGKVKIVSTGGVVYHSEQIPAGATVQFKVTCPAGYLATGGSVTSGDPRVLSLSSVRAGGGKSWSFGFRNTDAANAITVVVMVNCTKPALFGAGVKLKKKVVVVAPGQSTKVKAVCPPGEVPVGDGEKSVPPPKRASASSLAGIGGLQITSIVPSARDVTVGVTNPGTAAEQVEISAVCMKKHLSAGGKSGTFLVQRASFNETVPAGGSVVSGACPGALPLMAGFSLPPGSPAGFLGAGFSPGKFNAHWAFSNHSQEPGQAKAILVCTPGKLKFVKGLPAGSTSIDTQVGPITITG